MKIFFLILSLSLHGEIGNAAEFKPQVIYGADGRVDARSISDPRIIELARSSFAILEKKKLKPHGPLEFRIDAPTYQQEYNLCPKSDRFLSELSGAFCSGVLIAKDQVLTAGHCVQNKSECNDSAFVFDFQGSTVLQKDVYSCVKILSWANNGNYDFAVIQLDRQVANRFPIEVQTPPTTRPGDSLLMIGHPAGLPQKVTFGGRLRSQNNISMKTTLDAFESNSGSPVFDANTLKLVGLLVDGNDDFIEDSGARCNRIKACSESSCKGEDVVRLSAFVDQLP